VLTEVVLEDARDPETQSFYAHVNLGGGSWRPPTKRQSQPTPDVYSLDAEDVKAGYKAEYPAVLQEVPDLPANPPTRRMSYENEWQGSTAPVHGTGADKWNQDRTWQNRGGWNAEQGGGWEKDWEWRGSSDEDEDGWHRGGWIENVAWVRKQPARRWDDWRNNTNNTNNHTWRQ
jgi:hypothetical protein